MVTLDRERKRFLDRQKQERYRRRQRGEHVPFVMRTAPLPAGVTGEWLRALPSDAFACWVLAQGYYEVEVGSATVRNTRTGCVLRPQHNRKTGYYHIRLYATPKVSRTISLHRLVALTAWGADACAGKHVSHEDDDKAHNGIGNLRLRTPLEHIHFDFVSRGRHYGGTPRKTTWAPCARCGDPDGPKSNRQSRTPERVDGRRFGVAGRVCFRCYHQLYNLAKRTGQRVPTNGTKQTQSAVDVAPRSATPNGTTNAAGK
jgi:hypothetical protein